MSSTEVQPLSSILMTWLEFTQPSLTRIQMLIAGLRVWGRQSKLVTVASSAAEYRDLKHIDRGVAHDLFKLVERGLIKMSVGGRVTLVSIGAVVEAASAAPA